MFQFVVHACALKVGGVYFGNATFGGGGGGKARFNVATPLQVQHTYYCIIYKQNPFNIISRGVQR